MQIIGRLLVVVISMHYVHAVQGASNAATSATQSNCMAQLNTLAEQITEETTDQMNACILAFNQSISNNNVQVDAMVDISRANITTLQNNLANCTAITDDLSFVACIQNDYDVDQHLLTNANAKAEQAQSQLNKGENQAQSAQSSCLSDVMTASKKNTTDAANQFDNCLSQQ